MKSHPERPTCKEIAGRLAPMLDDRLEEHERDTIEEHVEGCPACKAEIARLSGGADEDMAFLEKLRSLRPPSAMSPVAPETTNLLPGLPTISGFRLLREIGRGGMGVVYEAVELALGRRVALKVVPRGDVGSSNAAGRFRREARSAARLHHTNIVPVFGVGEDIRYLYYAMQFIDGQGLDRVIDELRRERSGGSRPIALQSTNLRDSEATGTLGPKDEDELATASFGADVRVLSDPTLIGPLPPQTIRTTLASDAPGSSAVASGPGGARYRGVARIGLQVAEGLQFAHRQGILHRDVKPSNVLIDNTGTAWVADFGLAKTLDGEGDGLTRTGDIVGTLRYMAPERFDGRSDPRGDVYALGVTLYELITLRPVFEEANRAKLIERVLREEPLRPRSLDRRLPLDLETIVLKAMAKEPTARYATAGAMADDLRRFLAGEPIHARRSGPAERAWRWSRRKPAIAGLTAAVILASTLGFSLTLWKWQEAAGRTREAVAARSEARRLAADLLVDRGLDLLEKGESEAGRLWLARGQEAPEIAEDSRRVARLNLAAWGEVSPRLERIFAPPEGIGDFDFSADGTTLHTLTGASPIARHYDLATGVERTSSMVGGVRKSSSAVYTRLHDHGRTASLYTVQDRSLQFFEVSTGLPLGEPQVIEAMRFDPSGVAMACRLPAGVVRVWSLATGRTLGPDLPVAGGFALSPGGVTLLAAEPGGGKFLDVESGRLVGTAPLVPVTSTAVIYSPRGDFVTVEPFRSETESDDGRWIVRAWGSDGSPKGTSREVLDDPPLPESLSFGIGGDCLVVPTAWRIHLFDWRDPTRPNELSVVVSGAPVFSPDGATVAVGGLDGRVRLLDAFTGLPKGTDLIHASIIQGLRFLPDGSALAVRVGGEVRLWRLPDRPLAVKRPVADELNVFQTPEPAFSPKADRALVYSDRRQDVRIARSDSPPIGPVAVLGWNGLPRLVSSPDGRRWAATAHGGQVSNSTLRLLDADGTPIGDPLPHNNWLIDLAFSPDGKILAAAGYRGLVYLYHSDDGRLLRRPMVTGRITLSLAFSPDGKDLFVGTGPSTPSGKTVQLQVWDVASGTMRRSTDLDSWATHLTMSPDGRSLLIRFGSVLGRIQTGHLQLWDVATFRPRGELLEFVVPYSRAVAYLPGDRLLSGGPGGVWEWDVAAGKPKRLVIPMTKGVRSLIGDPGAHWIATLTESGEGQLFDAVTHRPIGPPLRSERPIRALAFDPEGRSIVAALDDATLRNIPLPSAGDPGPDAVLASDSGTLALDTGTSLSPETGAVQSLSAAQWMERLRTRPSRPSQAHSQAEARHSFAATAAESVGRPWSALWHLDRLARLRPKDWTVEARRAMALAAAGRFDEAAQVLDRISPTAPSEAYHSWLTGRVADSPVTALWYLDRAIIVNPEDVASLLHRSEVHESQGRKDRAEADLDLAVALGLPPESAVRCAERDGRADRWERAAKTLLNSMRRYPDPSGALLRLSVIAALKAGDSAAYQDACTRALEVSRRSPTQLSPNNAAYLCTLGPKAIVDYAKPVILIRQAVDAIPGEQKEERHSVLNTLGAILYRSGDPLGAVECLEKGVSEVGGRGVSEDWIFLALAHHAIGNEPTAQDYLARIHPTVGVDFWNDSELSLLLREVKLVVPAH